MCDAITETTSSPQVAPYSETVRPEFSVGAFRTQDADVPCTVHELIMFDQTALRSFPEVIDRGVPALVAWCTRTSNVYVNLCNKWGIRA